MYLLKCLKRCWFWLQMNDIPIVIWAKNWPVSTICDMLVALLFFKVIPKFQGWSIIDEHETQEHGMRIISHMPWPGFGSNDNSYSTPLFHEALDVDHLMVILGNFLYRNTSSLICEQHQLYPEHNTLCLHVLFYWIFFWIFAYQRLHVYHAL